MAESNALIRRQQLLRRDTALAAAAAYSALFQEEDGTIPATYQASLVGGALCLYTGLAVVEWGGWGRSGVPGEGICTPRAQRMSGTQAWVMHCRSRGAG